MRRRFRFRSYSAALNLLRNARNLTFRWTPAALDALIDVTLDLLWLSAIVFVIMFVTSGLLTRFVSMKAGMTASLLIGLFYLALVPILHYSYRAVNAIGLLLSVDMVANVAEYWRTGKITVRKVDRKGPDKPQWHLLFSGKKSDIALKFGTLQFFHHWLWILVNIMMNATWFAVLIPWPYYFLLFLVALYAGVNWLISHEEFDFDWFRWWGTVVGVTGFSGTILYMVAGYHQLHPYPRMMWFVTFLIGFTWATKHIKKYTLHAVVFGGILLAATYFWNIGAIAIALPSINLTPLNIFLGSVAVLVVILLVMIVWNGFEFEKMSEKTHGGNA